VGSTPTASTIFSLPTFFRAALNGVFSGGFEKSGCFLMVFLWFFRGQFVVFLRFSETRFSTSENMPTFENIFFIVRDADSLPLDWQRFAGLILLSARGRIRRTRQRRSSLHERRSKAKKNDRSQNLTVPWHLPHLPLPFGIEEG
jgi:hypothetical protein